MQTLKIRKVQCPLSRPQATRSSSALSFNARKRLLTEVYWFRYNLSIYLWDNTNLVYLGIVTECYLKL